MCFEINLDLLYSLLVVYSLWALSPFYKEQPHQAQQHLHLLFWSPKSIRWLFRSLVHNKLFRQFIYIGPTPYVSSLPGIDVTKQGISTPLETKVWFFVVCWKATLRILWIIKRDLHPRCWRSRKWIRLRRWRWKYI